MDPSAVRSQHAVGWRVPWNHSRMAHRPRWLLQVPEEEDADVALFLEYTPPAQDAVTLPRHMIYVLVGVVLVVVATYAIVGHLIKDLFHDLADWIFGPQRDEDDDECGPCVGEDREGEEGMTEGSGEEMKMESESPGAQQGRSMLQLPGLVSP